MAPYKKGIFLIKKVSEPDSPTSNQNSPRSVLDSLSSPSLPPSLAPSSRPLSLPLSLADSLPHSHSHSLPHSPLPAGSSPVVKKGRSPRGSSAGVGGEGGESGELNWWGGRGERGGRKGSKTAPSSPERRRGKSKGREKGYSSTDPEGGLDGGGGRGGEGGGGEEEGGKGWVVRLWNRWRRDIATAGSGGRGEKGGKEGKGEKGGKGGKRVKGETGEKGDRGEKGGSGERNGKEATGETRGREMDGEGESGEGGRPNRQGSFSWALGGTLGREEGGRGRGWSRKGASCVDGFEKERRRSKSESGERREGSGWGKERKEKKDLKDQKEKKEKKDKKETKEVGGKEKGGVGGEERPALRRAVTSFFSGRTSGNQSSGGGEGGGVGGRGGRGRVRDEGKSFSGPLVLMTGNASQKLQNNKVTNLRISGSMADDVRNVIGESGEISSAVSEISSYSKILTSDYEMEEFVKCLKVGTREKKREVARAVRLLALPPPSPRSLCRRPPHPRCRRKPQIPHRPIRRHPSYGPDFDTWQSSGP